MRDVFCKVFISFKWEKKNGGRIHRQMKLENTGSDKVKQAA